MKAGVVCRGCGEQVQVGASFCSKCGAPLVDVVVAPDADPTLSISGLVVIPIVVLLLALAIVALVH